MVNRGQIIAAIENHDISDIDMIDEIIKKHPYFQQAWTLKTYYLKQTNTYYNHSLQQTAARTIDRSVLFDYLNPNKPEDTINKSTAINKSISGKTANKPLAEPILKPTTEEQTENTEKIKKKNDRSTPPQTQKLSYIEWLKQLNRSPKKSIDKNIELIDKFLKERPKIIPIKDKTIKPPEIIEQSVVEKQMLMTETLANLYVKQKKYDKAIQAFRILSLKYPKKSSYFANQIKEIKQNLK